MSGATEQKLNQAYELIQQDKLDEARNLLQPLLETDADNPDVWWLYLHALENPAEARDALNHLKTLDENYPGINELSARVQQEAPDWTAEQPQEAPEDVVEDEFFDLDEDDIDLDEDDIDLDEDDDLLDIADEEEEGRRLPIRLLGALLVVIVIFIALIAILSPPGVGTPSTPIAGGGDVTDEPGSTDAPSFVATTSPVEATAEIEPTETVTDTPTETATEVEPTETSTETATEAEADETPDPATDSASLPEETTDATQASNDSGSDAAEFAVLFDALSDFDIAEDGINLQESRLGETVTVRVCTSIGLEANTTLNDVMLILAEQVEQLDETPDALAVNLGACEPGATSRLILVSTEDAQDFADGEIDEQTFQRLWQPG